LEGGTMILVSAFAVSALEGGLATLLVYVGDSIPALVGVVAVELLLMGMVTFFWSGLWREDVRSSQATAIVEYFGQSGDGSHCQDKRIVIQEREVPPVTQGRPDWASLLLAGVPRCHCGLYPWRCVASGLSRQTLNPTLPWPQPTPTNLSRTSRQRLGCNKLRTLSAPPGPARLKPQPPAVPCRKLVVLRGCLLTRGQQVWRGAFAP
jgi:hypothetical protein